MAATCLHDVTTDLVALEAVVRALVRVETRRSSAARAELLSALAEESDRLCAGALPNDPDVADVCAALGGWIENLKGEVHALRAPETAVG
jgi:hypothetical protein